MRVSLAQGLQGGNELLDRSQGHSTSLSPQLLGFVVCGLVLPVLILTSVWQWWCCGSSTKDDVKDNKSQSSRNSEGRVPSNSIRTAASRADSATQHGDADIPPNSTSFTTTKDTMRPGQPANPVSLPNQQSLATPQLTSPPKAAPGPSYESDDEDNGAATPEERLNDITRSVKGHAYAAGPGSVDEAARRQAKDAAKRLAAERHLAGSGTAAKATTAASAAATEPASLSPTDACARAATPAAGASARSGGSTATELASAGAGASAAAVHAEATATPGGDEADEQGGSDTYEIDLDINLADGELKVDYSTRGLLGQGGFAAVFKGRYKGQRVAVKIIKKTAGSTIADLQEDINALVHELNILRQVNHPNIVTLFGGCLKPPHIFLVEERMEGTLDFYVHTVRKTEPLSMREVVYFALDVASGLSYLHPRIVHRDLKPANVLLSREGRCKISDFGLARTKLKEYLSTKNLDAGTTAYIAPECFISMDNPDMHDLRRSVTDRTDIYALGIIMWEMVAGKRPWQGLKPLLVAYQVAYRSLRPPVFELGARCPPNLRLLIEACWSQEPKQRPSSQQLVDKLLEILNELPPEQDHMPCLPAHLQPALLQVVSPQGIVLH